MMSVATLREIRLELFKSFRDAVLPIDVVTVLTGRNNAGKSNALDAIEVLSRLATGEDIADALDGRRREGGPVRGGSRGCAPHGYNRFSLGCTVLLGEATYTLDVTVQVKPELRITSERLRGPAPGLESGKTEMRDLLITKPPLKNAAQINAEVYNGKRGSNPTLAFRDSRLLTAQLPLRIVPSNEVDMAVIRASEAIVSALSGVFHLDPVPHLMRDYVPERDTDLRRTGENVSGTLWDLHKSDIPTFNRIRDIVSQIGDDRIQKITMTRSDLGDVMFMLREKPGKYSTPAREVSDGLLRFIAIAAALLTSNRGLDIDRAQSLALENQQAGVLLVIEELENGLHPSQAERVLELINEVSSEFSKQVLVTTHSPALLNAMTGELNNNVIVCYRDLATGFSKLSRLPDLEGYVEAMAAGRLGDAVSKGMLVRPDIRDTDFSQFERLLGID